MVKGNFYVIAWTVLLFVVVAESGQVCLSCSNVREGEDCLHHITCNADEVCFTQAYTTMNSEKLYDYGCTYSELCHLDNFGQIFGKRSGEHGHVSCQKCCNSTRLCNMDLDCQNTIAVPLQICYACNGVTDPKYCNTPITCGHDEFCFVQKFLSETKMEFYDLGCKHKNLCSTKTASVVGRRSSFGRHLLCENCCSDRNLCNRNINCARRNTPATNLVPSTTTAPTTTLVPSTTTAPTTTLAKPTSCFVCGNLNQTQNSPCSTRELFISNTSSAVQCPTGSHFCMTDILHDAHGNERIFKRCVTEQTCQTKWITESADLDYCSKYGYANNPSAFECHFCCSGDYCNSGLKPPASLLVSKPTGR